MPPHIQDLEKDSHTWRAKTPTTLVPMLQELSAAQRQIYGAHVTQPFVTAEKKTVLFVGQVVGMADRNNTQACQACTLSVHMPTASEESYAADAAIRISKRTQSFSSIAQSNVNINYHTLRTPVSASQNVRKVKLRCKKQSQHQQSYATDASLSNSKRMHSSS